MALEAAGDATGARVDEPRGGRRSRRRRAPARPEGGRGRRVARRRRRRPGPPQGAGGGQAPRVDEVTAPSSWVLASVRPSRLMRRRGEAVGAAAGVERAAEAPPAGEVPGDHRPVGGRGVQRVSAAVEGQPRHPAGVALQGLARRPGLDVPNDHVRVLAGGDEEAAVGRELRAVDGALWRPAPSAAAGPQVEEAHGAVGAARRERPSVRGQRARPKRTRGSCAAAVASAGRARTISRPRGSPRRESWPGKNARVARRGHQPPPVRGERGDVGQPSRIRERGRPAEPAAGAPVEAQQITILLRPGRRRVRPVHRDELASVGRERHVDELDVRRRHVELGQLAGSCAPSSSRSTPKPPTSEPRAARVEHELPDVRRLRVGRAAQLAAAWPGRGT